MISLTHGLLMFLKVWSFSPPDDAYSERPVSLPQRLTSCLSRSVSVEDQQPAAVSASGSSPAEEPGIQDVDMRDAGSSAGPLNATFFHDD